MNFSLFSQYLNALIIQVPPHIVSITKFTLNMPRIEAFWPFETNGILQMACHRQRAIASFAHSARTNVSLIESIQKVGGRFATC